MGQALIRLLPLRALSDPVVALGAPALLFLMLSVRAALAPVTDPDVWWIAVAGRDLLATGRVPVANVHSFADAAHPWVMHEWLLAVPYALGLTSLGSLFVILLGLVSAATTYGLLVRATVGRCRHTAAGASLALVALAGCRECFFSPRPGYVTFALVLLLAEIAFAPRWSRRLALAGVLLQVTWTNVHGSFPLGIALLVAGALAAETDRLPRGATASVAAVGTLVNPYGLGLYALVGRYLAGTDHAMVLIHTHITEFAPLWRLQWPFANPYALLAAGIVACLAASALGHGRHRARAAVTLLCLVLAVVHARHLALAVLVGCALLGPEADDLMAVAGLPILGASLRPRSPWAIVAPGFAVGLAVLAVATVCGKGVRVDPRLGGTELLRLVARLPPGARVYAPFESSGRVVWLRHGSVQILLDPRNDCYTPEVLEVGFGLETGALTGARALAVMDSMGVGWALLPDGHAVMATLRGASTWTTVARDGAWTLQRRGWADGSQGDLPARR